MRERQQRRKYRREKEAERRAKAERIFVMEMLLEAKWMGDCFRQTRWINDLPVVCFYDIDGNVINSKQKYGW